MLLYNFIVHFISTFWLKLENGCKYLNKTFIKLLKLMLNDM